jgi:benzodiazapine receptor
VIPKDIMTSTDQQKLQNINFANLLGYFLNTLVTYGVGVSDMFPSNSEISEKYQTLITPAGFAFAIWGVIFTSQLIWAVVQMLPKYRARDVVIYGVGWNYVYACMAQMAWSLCFTTEHIALSLIAMVSILIPLVMILTKLSQLPSESIGYYWLLKFPFEIHAAWIMAATLVNANVLLVACNLAPSIQVGAAWLSLGVLASTSFYYTYKQKWVVPAVLAWASNAINSELSNPRGSIANTFSMESIDALQVATGVLAAVIMLGMITMFLYRRFFVPDTSETEENHSQSLHAPLTMDE